MISPDKLLTDLKRWVLRLEDDLRKRCKDKDYPEVNAHFSDAYATAKTAGRTAHPYETWLDQELTQVAVGWVLGMVFVRFLEDNCLVDQPCISGPGERRTLAAEVKEQYFKQSPGDSDNDYLRHTFKAAAQLPGMADLFDQRHNPLWQAQISGDAARELIEFWRKIDNDSGELVHDFTDPEWSTRFLGDLYQNLSEAAQKRFALLQTPDFVESFILDRTLDPAIESFGYKVVRLIDPACGSGHFLLGAFARMLEHFRRGDDRLSPKEVASLALGAIYGVDINPFAIAIARFRLLLEAWKYAGVKRLKAAPAFKVNLAVGDALFHSAEPGEVADPSTLQLRIESANASYGVEDAAELARIFGQKYHAVVANPPYIVVKDTALNNGYRNKFHSCHRKYSMAAPFMELIFDLAVKGDPNLHKQAGYTGQITSNSFMKREFGKKLVEECIPTWDLTHVLDTSGCYIPGHGTPTVILFGKHQAPVSGKVRAVLGINGEPGTPEDPAKGVVWSAILEQIDQPGSESESVSANDSERVKFGKHPWSIGGGGGGGAAELKIKINSNCKQTLSDILSDSGRSSHTGEDDFFYIPANVAHTIGILSDTVELTIGENVRDYEINSGLRSIFPYSHKSAKPKQVAKKTNQIYWSNRTNLKSRRDFGQSIEERGLLWTEHSMFFPRRFLTQPYLCFAFVATHNHFSYSSEVAVFKQSAPLLFFKSTCPLKFLGALNSSICLFWARETLFPKGGYPEGRWQERLEWDVTKLKRFPISEQYPDQVAIMIHALIQNLSVIRLNLILKNWKTTKLSLSAELDSARLAAASLRASMIALQEELDWQCYGLYGLVQTSDNLEWPEDRLDELPELSLGERTFEILMARQMATGELETTWFARHSHAGSKPITELPAHWPADYKALVERRIQCIAESKNINLIERPEYKRRWNTEPWAKRQEAALRKWLLTRLEAYFHDADRMIDIEDEAQRSTVLEKLKAPRASFPAGQGFTLCSTKQLADAAQLDPQWMEAAQVYTGSEGFNVAKLVQQLVEKESVPYLPSLRYKESGLRNRLQWERTWEQQRAEDAIEARVTKDHPEVSDTRLKELIRDAQQAEVGDIPVPPKYKSKDFKKGSYWNLRGKLDVAKERWVSYPGAERNEDSSPVIAWAGWDHKQQIQALGAYYYERQNEDGWKSEQLLSLLAGMQDLIPWVQQWHPGIDAEFGQDLGEFYQGFIRDQLHDMNLTDADLDKERMEP